MAYAGKYYWIIGASSGIGRALALELARQGAVVAISARTGVALESLAREISTQTLVLPLDITRREDIQAALDRLREAWPRLDGVVIMSAVYTPLSFSKMELKQVLDIVNVNLTGILNVILSVLPVLRAQKSGQLALCGSVAGYRGLPNAQPYGSTKAAIINLAESLKIEEEKNGIDVRLINPGFVKTPMTDKNDFAMPMMIDVDQAAVAISRGLQGNKFEIHFPKRFTYIMKILRLMPSTIYFFLMRKLEK